MVRRSYDKQFKMAAVKLVLEDNMTVAEVSKELDMGRKHYLHSNTEENLIPCRFC